MGKAMPCIHQMQEDQCHVPMRVDEVGTTIPFWYILNTITSKQVLVG